MLLVYYYGCFVDIFATLCNEAAQHLFLSSVKTTEPKTARFSHGKYNTRQMTIHEYAMRIRAIVVCWQHAFI
jgi:hypothetical protein